MIADQDHYDSLSEQSNKKVKMICDYCNVKFLRTKKSIFKAKQLHDKDSCNKCKYIKRKEIEQLKYGTSNSAQRKEVKEKISKSKNDIDYRAAHKKAKQTCLKKYGAENPMQVKSIKEKHQQVVLDKYGVHNISQLEEVKEKRKDTCLERFGAEYYLGSQECKDKVKEKYGVDNVGRLPEVKEKIRQTMNEKYGGHYMSIPKNASNAKTIEIQNKINNGLIRTHKSKTISEWAEEIGYSRSHFNVLVNKHGFDRAVHFSPRMSSLEQSMSFILDELELSYEKQYYVEGKYADFYIPAYNLVIECDGLYWHSEVNLDKYYHRDKRDLYIKNDLRPLFFREDEINNKASIVKSIIQNKCGLSNRVFARKTNVARLDKQTAKDFFSTNHLMGQGRGDSIGLYYNGELLSVLQYRKVKGDQYEISRFAHKKGFNVIGGFSKLLKQAPQNIFTFIDLRYGSGDYLISLGFKQEKTHLSFKWTNGQTTWHRMSHPSNSGYNAGLTKIWDCGQAKFTNFY